MGWSVKLFLNSALLGVGLAMDAFATSVADGLSDLKMKKSKMLLVAGVFGFFQFAMPLAGWVCIHTVLEHFRVFEKLIPWIALILLLFIGGKMIYEGIGKKQEEEKIRKLTVGVLLIQGIATSIDALSVGFTIAEYDLSKALAASLIIGVVTFIISLIGLKIGKKVGTRFSEKAQILGGIILIAIGLEIFLTGIF